MSWTGTYEADAPAWYYVNPPEESWDDEAKDEWRSMFSATTLPAITVHEVTPVTAGERLVMITFIESQVPDQMQRDLLYTLKEVRALEGHAQIVMKSSVVGLQANRVAQRLRSGVGLPQT